MADVTIPPEPEGDRAQMLLVGAFGVAVMLVVLALVLNTAIYTENIATRGGDIIGGKDALQYRSAVEAGTGGTITYVNYHNNTSASNVRAEANASMAAWSNLSGQVEGLGGQVTDVTVVDATTGTRVYQNAERNFTNATEDGTYRVNWTLVRDAPALRNFTMTVDNTTLGSLGTLGPEEVFLVSVSGTSGERRVKIYRQADGTFTVAVLDGAGSSLGTCERSTGATANVSITGATVEGERCKPLEFFGALSGPYDVTYNNTKGGGTDTISGTYSMVVSRANGDPAVAENFGSMSGYDVPDLEPAVYAVTVRVVYRTPRLLYRTTFRVAPGEPDG